MPYSIARKDDNTDKAQKLADEDRRSLSNYIEILVDRAWKEREDKRS